ncbi:MAG TPA: hypothetical protein VJL31_02040 [Gemmatimonadales bacterium]|nr:hypothetical protein [Gemmatimonadales bacterium]
MLSARQGLLLLAPLSVCFAVPGCSRTVAPEDLPDISGAWNYAETLLAERGTVACNIVGTLAFVQEGEALVGSYSRSITCSGTKGLTSRVESGQIPSGRVSETGVEFRLAGCDYRGTFTDEHAAGTSPERITGTTLCTNGFETALADGGASSAWAADRLAEASP